MNSYSVFVLVLLVVYATVDIALLVAVMMKRKHISIKMRTPELVLISGVTSLAMVVVILLQEFFVSEDGSFTCVPALWASHLYPPLYALPYILRSIRLLVAHKVRLSEAFTSSACVALDDPCCYGIRSHAAFTYGFDVGGPNFLSLGWKSIPHIGS